MAHINVVGDPASLSEPWMVEGLPGAGLVGKIAADHLVEEFSMDLYAHVHCEGIPQVAVYDESAALRPPVRLHVEEAAGLVVLTSDVPVTPSAAGEVAECLAGWFDDHRVRPLYLSGLPGQKDEAPPAVFGVATGEGHAALEEAGVEAPDEGGLVSGPTGALLSHAVETDRTAVALVVETDPRFPDPEAASVLLDKGIGPITGAEVGVDELVDRAEEIRRAREQLAERMRKAGEESTRAQPLRMYQ
jgi:uncharacterized protein